ncbi:hypothetical protein HHL08_12805 [Sphingobium sp. AR-3-1]|uniref:Uncharacterized protein n=1 Tax=Sphingobium psychrophilum TaxID=2728834 RepID=A0A7X9WW89_9SPHN|nr:hypothetical protein [Sphingobium psychrophilum]NML11014.1 hypothetical protein [Sphingobium psychrophilum]
MREGGNDYKDDIDLPSQEDLLRYVNQVSPPDYQQIDYESDYQSEFRSSSVRAQEDFEHLLGVASHYRHKGLWSYFLMLVMAGLISFQCFLLTQVGFGYWDFTKYDWLLPLLLVQNFAQIIGLAVFVVKALFKPIR